MTYAQYPTPSQPVALSAPTSVVAAFDNPDVNVTWVNNSEAPVKIYRDGAVVGSVDAGVTEFVDTTVAPDTWYAYTAKAFFGTTYSVASNTSNVFTGVA